MANIVEQRLVVKFSKLVREDYEGETNLVTDEHVEVIDATMQEIFDDKSIIIEVEKPDVV